MALKTYIGARYAPEFMGAWNKANEYAALSVVYHDNQSYVSRKTVPAETDITNTEYWIRSSDWNAQVDEYRNQVNGYDEKVVQYNQNVEAYNTNVNNFFEETIHAYNTKEDMVNDESVKLGYTLITCGETSIGDGGGAFYQAVSETSSSAVALKNGLFAKKFQLMPERFNRWTVNNWSFVTNLTLAKGDIVTNLNITGQNATDVYLPNKKTSTVKLFGIINSAEYYDEYSSLTADSKITGDFRYFLVPGNNNKYLAFKILNFTYDYSSLNEIGYPGPIYLLPRDVCINELPCGKVPDIQLYISSGSRESNDFYIIKMPPTPNDKTVLGIMVGDTPSPRTINSYPSEYYVMIGYAKMGNEITITSYPPLPQSAGNTSLGGTSSNIIINDIKGIICTTPIVITSAVTSVTINFGNCGSFYSTLYESYYVNRSLLIPFNNTTGSTKTIDIIGQWSSPQGGQVTSGIPNSIPSGRSLFVAVISEQGPRNVVMTQLL